MTLQDLLQWGVARKVPGVGARRRLYAAETDILSLVARVFRERELRLVDETIRHLEEVVRILEDEGRSSNATEMLRGRFLVTRVRRLLDLTRVGRQVVARLAMTGSADLAPIRELLRFKRS
jgi:DNA-binding transcriptional regulator GbsR (MarR family)